MLLRKIKQEKGKSVRVWMMVLTRVVEQRELHESVTGGLAALATVRNKAPRMEPGAEAESARGVR